MCMWLGLCTDGQVFSEARGIDCLKGGITYRCLLLHAGDENQTFVRSILAVSHRTISWRYNLNKLCTMFIYFLFNKKARITVNTLFFITILWMDNALFHLQTSTNKTLDQALNVSVYLKLQSKLYPVVYGSFRIMLRFSKSHGEYM